MSRTIIQSYSTGVVEPVELPRSALQANGVVQETRCSVISPGTERSLTDLARARRQNILDKNGSWLRDSFVSDQAAFRALYSFFLRSIVLRLIFDRSVSTVYCLPK